MDHHSIEGLRHKMGSATHTTMTTEGEFRLQKERLELLLIRWDEAKLPAAKHPPDIVAPGRASGQGAGVPL
jgi:hypothetical protein